MASKVNDLLNIETGYSISQLAEIDGSATTDLIFDTADPALKGINQFARGGHYALLCAGGPITRPDHAGPMTLTAIRAGYDYLQSLELESQHWNASEAEAALNGLIRQVEPALGQKSRDLRDGQPNTSMTYEGATVGAVLLYKDDKKRQQLGVVSAGDTTIAYFNNRRKGHYVAPSNDDNLRTEYQGTATISTQIVPVELGKNRVILHQGFGRSDLGAMPDKSLAEHSDFQSALKDFNLQPAQAAQRVIEISASDLFNNEPIEPDGRLAYVIDLSLAKQSILGAIGRFRKRSR